MADANNLPAGPSDEQLAEAKSLGWAPKEAWRGAPEKWVDADAYLERGLGIHHVRSNLEQERTARTQLEARLAETEGAVRAANAALAALEESADANAKAQAEAAKQELINELAEAHKDGDHALAATLTAKLAEVNVATAAPTKEKEKPPVVNQVPEAVKAELQQWSRDNAEFLKDKRRVALSNVIAEELRASGDRTVGKAFMDKVVENVEKEIGASSRNGHRKVEGGGGGESAGGGGGGGTGKTYADLPADAKAACDRQGARLVGAGKAHKDINSWRASYVRQYFGS